MRRVISQDLQNWLISHSRKPLIMRGARQVGKTWLVRDFANQSQKKLIEINFELKPELYSVFKGNEPKIILRNIELSLGITININESILFLDEIQNYPEIIAKLRWFYELLPTLPVIVAGSLLDFALEQHTFSMPVGRISYLHVEPLSFEEFLLAKQLDSLVAFIQSFQIDTQVPEVIHNKLMFLFKEFLVVGGMPAAVSMWIETGSLQNVARVHSELLLTYRDDFSKYSGKLPTQHLEEVMSAVPKFLGHKFIYTHVNRDTKIAMLKSALHLLCKARICYLIKATAANGIPLLAEVNEKYFKVGFIDVGLVSSMLHLRLDQFEAVNDINLINQGAISEQVVWQLLRTTLPVYMEPANFYWCREEKSASAEIDAIIQHDAHIIPIEIKSGATGSLKSLHYFMAEKKGSIAIRINSDTPSQVPVLMKTSLGKQADYRLLSVPFYLTQQISHLLKQLK